eukprot:snap_masked-scaffold_7-processed-gene-2.39-mRNA-1 protein AED:1.00 eAED:1.00 QI:0/-1/0/0/-1/1/1/0/844
MNEILADPTWRPFINEPSQFSSIPYLLRYFSSEDPSLLNNYRSKLELVTNEIRRTFDSQQRANNNSKGSTFDQNVQKFKEIKEDYKNLKSNMDSWRSEVRRCKDVLSSSKQNLTNKKIHAQETLVSLKTNEENIKNKIIYLKMVKKSLLLIDSAELDVGSQKSAVNITEVKRTLPLLNDSKYKKILENKIIVVESNLCAFHAERLMNSNLDETDRNEIVEQIKDLELVNKVCAKIQSKVKERLIELLETKESSSTEESVTNSEFDCMNFFLPFREKVEKALMRRIRLIVHGINEQFQLYEEIQKLLKPDTAFLKPIDSVFDTCLKNFVEKQFLSLGSLDDESEEGCLSGLPKNRSRRKSSMATNKNFNRFFTLRNQLDEAHEAQETAENFGFQLTDHEKILGLLLFVKELKINKYFSEKKNVHYFTQTLRYLHSVLKEVVLERISYSLLICLGDSYADFESLLLGTELIGVNHPLFSTILSESVGKVENGGGRTCRINKTLFLFLKSVTALDSLQEIGDQAVLNKIRDLRQKVMEIFVKESESTLRRICESSSILKHLPELWKAGTRGHSNLVKERELELSNYRFSNVSISSKPTDYDVSDVDILRLASLVSNYMFLTKMTKDKDNGSSFSVEYEVSFKKALQALRSIFRFKLQVQAKIHLSVLVDGKSLPPMLLKNEIRKFKDEFETYGPCDLFLSQLQGLDLFLSDLFIRSLNEIKFMLSSTSKHDKKSREKKKNIGSLKKNVDYITEEDLGYSSQRSVRSKSKALPVDFLLSYQDLVQRVKEEFEYEGLQSEGFEGVFSFIKLFLLDYGAERGKPDFITVAKHLSGLLSPLDLERLYTACL